MMGASPRCQTGFADYLDLLRVFDEREAEALIVGGQAVNFWAEVFEEEEPELQTALKPNFTMSVRSTSGTGRTRSTFASSFLACVHSSAASSLKPRPPSLRAAPS